MIKDSKYIEFIHKKLTGSIDAKEDALLEEWLSTSADNKTIAEEVEKAWDYSKDYLTDYQPKAEEGLLKLKARIAKEQAPVIVKTLPRRSWLLKLVAAIALLVGIGASINYFTNQGGQENWLAQQTNENGIEKHTLSDGSIVWLNQNSRLDYPETFNGNQRVVKLEGEAFFDIAKDETKPFIIQIDEALVKVLGTSFNVRSYEAEEEVEVTVRSGKVQFEVEELDEKMILQPADCYRYNKVEKMIEKEKDDELNALSWQTKRLAFEKIRLETVLTQIEKHYNIKIRVQDQNLKNCRFTAKFEDTPLKDVLEIIKASFSLKINSLDKDEYLLVGGQCN